MSFTNPTRITEVAMYGGSRGSHPPRPSPDTLQADAISQTESDIEGLITSAEFALIEAAEALNQAQTKLGESTP